MQLAVARHFRPRWRGCFTLPAADDDARDASPGSRSDINVRAITNVEGPGRFNSEAPQRDREALCIRFEALNLRVLCADYDIKKMGQAHCGKLFIGGIVRK